MVATVRRACSRPGGMQSPLSLNPHRHPATSLAQLSQRGGVAARNTCTETSALLGRAPHSPTMLFELANGPFGCPVSLVRIRTGSPPALSLLNSVSLHLLSLNWREYSRCPPAPDRMPNRQGGGDRRPPTADRRPPTTDRRPPPATCRTGPFGANHPDFDEHVTFFPSTS